jgi:predicted oxidoreductase
LRCVLQDFGTFYQAGITSWDAADHYGPAEVLIGRYLQQHPEQRQNIQVGAGHSSSCNTLVGCRCSWEDSVYYESARQHSLDVVPVGTHVDCPAAAALCV